MPALEPTVQSAPLDFRLVLPALALWLGLIAGLVAAPLLSGPTMVTVAVVGAGVGSGAGVYRRRRGRLRPAPPARSRPPPDAGSSWRPGCVSRGLLAAACLCAAGLGVGVLERSTAAADPLVGASAAGSWASLTLTVTGLPQSISGGLPVTGSQGSMSPDGLRWRITGTATTVQVAGRAWRPTAAVTVFGFGRSWAAVVPGSTVVASGLLAPDQYSVLPAVVVRARGDPVLVGQPPWYQRAAATVRGDLVRSATGMTPDPRGLLPGLVVGDTSGISDRLTADAKITGLTHLLAVSGSHFAVLCGAVLVVLRRFGQRLAAVGGAVVLAAVVILVGPQPSVLRAAVMAGVATMAMLLGRGRSALPALAAATVVLLLADPELALAPGFGLSVLATAALILLAPSWSTALRRRGVPAGWADLLAMPAAAGVATLPVVAGLSGSVSLVGLPANIAVAPVVPVALVLGVLCAAVGPIWPAGGRLLAQGIEPLLSWVATVAHGLARWPAAAVPWPATPGGVTLLAGLTVGGLLALRHRRVRGLALAGICGAAVVLVPAQLVAVGWPPPGWLLVGCEVGQGDGMVLSTGVAGSAVVVDVGPDPQLIDGCLGRLGITSIALLVITHLHADHVGGLAGAVGGRTVGEIGIGPDRSSAAALRAIAAVAVGRNVPVRALSVGSQWGGGDLTLDVVGPDKPFVGTDSDPNNDSVVLMASRGSTRILMTGDIEREAQQQLLYRRLDLHADVLEQPHHGSAKFLPAFLAAVGPRVSVVGVGLDNDYGQPSPRALAMLAGAGVSVLRTDLSGDVAVCLADDQLSTAVRGPALRSTRNRTAA